MVNNDAMTSQTTDQMNDEVQALLCHIDIAIACHDYQAIWLALEGLQSLFKMLEKYQAASHATTIMTIINENSDDDGLLLPQQMRINNLLRMIRTDCFEG